MTIVSGHVGGLDVDVWLSEWNESEMPGFHGRSYALERHTGGMRRIHIASKDDFLLLPYHWELS